MVVLIGQDYFTEHLPSSLMWCQVTRFPLVPGLSNITIAHICPYISFSILFNDCNLFFETESLVACCGTS